jgi:hypothetical protein
MQDKRYAAVKALLEAGGIKEIAELFSYISKTNVYKKLGLGYTTFLRKMSSPGLFTLNELADLAALIGVDSQLLINIASANMRSARKDKPTD